MDYKEEQRIKSPLVLGLVLFSAALAVTGAGFFVYAMVQEGESIYKIISMPLFVLLAFSVAYYLVFLTTLETDVSREGFGYRYAPILRRRKVIAFHDVVHWQIKKTKHFNDLDGFGYKKAVFSRKSGYIMHTNNQVEFTLKDGSAKVFSIDNTEMMRMRLRKYFAEKEIS